MKQSIMLIIVSSLLSIVTRAQSLEPGIWKTKTSFNLSGISLPTKEEEGCVSAEEAKDAKKTISEGLKKQGCELNQWNVKKNKLQAELSCQSKDIQAKGKIHGTFSKKTYSLAGEADGTYKNAIPTSATIIMSGEWIKKCEK